jgi:hypothetical protein
MASAAVHCPEVRQGSKILFRGSPELYINFLVPLADDPKGRMVVVGTLLQNPIGGPLHEELSPTILFELASYVCRLAIKSSQGRTNIVHHGK